MIYAMSDIHGCMEELEEQMKNVDLSGDNRLILLGDYIDYGHKSGQVVRYIYELQNRYGKDKVVVLKGNHEAMFLEWIDEFGKTMNRNVLPYDSWLISDSEQNYNVLGTFISEDQLNELTRIEKNASFAKINTEAVKMVLKSSGELVRWLRSLPDYYETEKQIFVHAGVDEEAGEDWKWETGDETFLWKYPPTVGKFYKMIIAGHVGSGTAAGDKEFHDIYHDGESHYFIDGAVYKGGKLLLLGYDEKNDKYYQIEGLSIAEVKGKLK